MERKEDLIGIDVWQESDSRGHFEVLSLEGWTSSGAVVKNESQLSGPVQGGEISQVSSDSVSAEWKVQQAVGIGEDSSGEKFSFVM